MLQMRIAKVKPKKFFHKKIYWSFGSNYRELNSFCLKRKAIIIFQYYGKLIRRIIIAH